MRRVDATRRGGREETSPPAPAEQSVASQGGEDQGRNGCGELLCGLC